jgi:hypothetical protein
VQTLPDSYRLFSNVNARHFLTKDEWACARETVQINAQTVQFDQNRPKSRLCCCSKCTDYLLNCTVRHENSTERCVNHPPLVTVQRIWNKDPETKGQLK